MEKGKASKIDLSIYFFFIIVALVMMKPALDLGLGEIGELGPGLLPFVALLCVFFMSAALAILSLVHRQPPISSETVGKMGLSAWIRVGEILLSLVVWPLLVGVIGYILATFIVCLGMSKAIGYQGWLRPILLSGSVAFSIWFIFGFMFYVDLPAGFSF